MDRRPPGPRTTDGGMSQLLAPLPDATEPRPWAPTARPAVPRETAKAIPDVSICIANWNCRDYLHGCLKSILERPQGVSVEVIVVDNASTDGATEMVTSEFPNVVLVRNAENHGFARASNQAAICATGRYIFFLNNDTIVPPGTLSRLVAFADAHPQIGMIGPRLARWEWQVADLIPAKTDVTGHVASRGASPMDGVIPAGIRCIPPRWV